MRQALFMDKDKAASNFKKLVDANEAAVASHSIEIITVKEYSSRVIQEVRELGSQDTFFVFRADLEPSPK